MIFRNSLLFCCLLPAVLLTTFSKAQYLQKPIRVLTTKDGLPQSFISGLVQDKDGFVWIGTRNGMARYDGIHLKLFQHSSRDTASLRSNLIISLKQDQHNRIWIEHESSHIDCFDPVTETTERITGRPLFRSHPLLFVRKGWLVDATGNLWCVQRANGIYTYNWKQNSITHFTHNMDKLPSDTIKGLFEDRMQQVWVVSQRGISRYQPETGRFEHRLFPFVTDFNNDENWNAQIVAVHERKNGEIMLGDRRQLIFYNPVTKTFRTVLLPVFPKTGIRWIQQGPDGYEYLESEGIVYRYNEKSGLVAVGDIGLVSFRDIHSFLIDQSGLIWLGTNAAGIHQIDLTAPFFASHPTTYSFHYDLLRQQLGIELDKLGGWPLADKEFLATSYWFRSTYDAHDKLWLALRNKVAYYDTSQKKYVLLPPVPAVSEQDNLSWGIRGICFAPDGTLWVIGDKGYIYYMDTLHQKWVTFLDAAWMKKNYSDFTLHDAVADSDKLWISSGAGLFCIDIKTKHIRQLHQQAYPGLLPTDLLLGLQQDPTRSGLLWIGTYEGLVCLNKKTLKSEFFSVEEGLPDNTIYAIQTDKAGYLWLSTNKGLCRFHPVSHEVKIFQTADGLPGDEFNRFHSIKLPDGRLAFGGTDGWTLFDPTMIKADNYQPPVAFTGFKINNVPVNHRSADGPLPGPLNSLTELSLPYDQNSLTLEFAGLEFNRPQKLLYRYWLKSYDDQWIVTPNPAANYTKLPPGHYLLSINATNTTGQWSPHIRTLRLIIRPPFWRTWWAYGLYFLLLAGLIWAYIQHRLNQERLRQEVSMKEKEAVQLKVVDELKTRFFSNITHEFRTPLTLILTPAQQLKPTLHLQNQHRWIAAIERNAYQLLRLINQLLDLSKLESGSLQVHETRGSIRQFIEGRVETFQPEAETNGISLAVRADADSDNYWFDADKLEHIVNNLLANALKFTPSGGQVQLEYSTEKPVAATKQKNAAGQIDSSGSKGIYLTVSDTGTGIPPDEFPNIFDRFYQVNTSTTSSSHPKGSGIGLSLVKELVDLQGGTMEVSSPGKDPAIWNTTFTIWLPYRQALASDLPAPEPVEGTQPASHVFLPRPDAFSTASAGEEAPETTSILLIEDNMELAEFIADSLPNAFQLSQATNGAAGLEMALELMPDLIISDVLMPVMDGLECCGKLKADERTSHIPVILLTAKASFDSRIEGLSQGADDYLTKPFHVQELQLRVANLLERQRRTREKLRQELSRPVVAESPSSTGTQTGTQDVFIQKLYNLIEKKLDDSSFGVQELASEIGMSRTNLHNKLKATTGMPASEIIRNYRLKRAVQFLHDGYNSSETAYRTGFHSPAYFSKCFRQFYQVTPLEYNQKAR